MTQEKELALIFSFDKAPDKVKKAAQVSQNSWIRLQKADDQLAKWTEERAAAKAAYNQDVKTFKTAVTEWDPAEIADSKMVDAPAEAITKDGKK